MVPKDVPIAPKWAPWGPQKGSKIDVQISWRPKVLQGVPGGEEVPPLPRGLQNWPPNDHLDSRMPANVAQRVTWIPNLCCFQTKIQKRTKSLKSIENLPSKLSLGSSGGDHVEPSGCHKGQGRTLRHTEADLKRGVLKTIHFPKKIGAPLQMETPFGPLLSTPNGQRFST